MYPFFLYLYAYCLVEFTNRIKLLLQGVKSGEILVNSDTLAAGQLPSPYSADGQSKPIKGTECTFESYEHFRVNSSTE